MVMMVSARVGSLSQQQEKSEYAQAIDTIEDVLPTAKTIDISDHNDASNDNIICVLDKQSVHFKILIMRTFAQTLLSSARILQVLKITCRIPEQGIRELVPVLADENCSLQTLAVTEFTHEKVLALSPGISANKSLKELAIHFGGVCRTLEDSASSALENALRSHPKLEVLRLKGPDSSIYSGLSFWDGLDGAIAGIVNGDVPLKELDLWSLPLEDDFTETFDALTTCETMQKVRFAFCIGFGDEAAVGLAKALLTNSSITDVDVQGSHFGNDGAAAFGQVLKTNDSLQRLHLVDIEGNAGTIALLDGLSSNSSLLSLGLYCRREVRSKIDALLDANRALSFCRATMEDCSMVSLWPYYLSSAAAQRPFALYSLLAKSNVIDLNVLLGRTSNRRRRKRKLTNVSTWK